MEAENKSSGPIKRRSKRKKKIGKAPGTVTYMGNREGLDSSVHLISYTDAELQEFDDMGLDIFKNQPRQQTLWYDIVGLSNESYIEALGQHLQLNALVLEDIVNTEQRPKIDEYEEVLFGVLKMIYIDKTKKVSTEHVALVLQPEKVVVFQEIEEDVFDGVRNRLRSGTGRIRSRGADYLFFALIDAIIDNYFIVLDHFYEAIEALEAEVYTSPTNTTVVEIQKLKKELLKFRNGVVPVKELMNKMIHSESEMLGKDTRMFFSDAHDHCTEINDTIQIQREMVMSLMEMYMSNISNKMNEVMKVLTIMASIFIPLTFIAGIYGMNFRNMPELQSEYGYYVVLGVMLILLVGMLIYFKRKRWI